MVGLSDLGSMGLPFLAVEDLFRFWKEVSNRAEEKPWCGFLHTLRSKSRRKRQHHRLATLVV